MKTPMQELLEAYDSKNLFSLKEWIDKNREKLLQKERNILIETFNFGEKNIDFKALHGYGKTSTAEKYFNDKFNVL